MAKDRRNKVRPQMNLDEIYGGSSQTDSSDVRSSTSRTDLASRSENRRPSQPKRERKPKKKKKKLSHAALVIRCVLAVLLLAVLIFLCVLGNYIYQAVFVDEREKVPPISPTAFDTTPSENTNKVAYYLLGVLGAKDSSDMSMISVICHDKQKQTMQVLQLPALTYIESGDQWVVSRLGSVWAKPKPYDWCETCRKRVYEPEIDEGEVPTHTVCGGEITQKTGSSTGSLVDFVNDQLALPVDAYFIIPQEGLRILVDSVGGVDVKLSSDLTLDDTSFTEGVHTLSGAQAVDYMTYMDGTLKRDLIRLTRQRQVLGALFARMMRLDKDTLEEDVIEEVMDSTGAMRTEKSVSEITDIILSMASAGLENTTVYRLPGEEATDENDRTVFSVHSEELLTLLSSAFNPYGAAITASDVTLPELLNTTKADVKQQQLSDCVTDQTGMLLQTGE